MLLRSYNTSHSKYSGDSQMNGNGSHLRIPNVTQMEDTAVLKQQIYTYAVPSLIFLCLVGALANLTVLLIGRLVRTTHNGIATITFARGLAAADFWTSLVIGTGLLVNSYLPYVFGIMWPLCLSYVIEGLRLGAIMTSVLFLLAIAINHRIITENAHKITTDWLSRRWTYFLVVLMWLLPPIGFLVTFASIPGQGFLSEGCMVRKFMGQFWFRMVIFLLFLVPLVCLSAIYIQIILRLRRMDHQLRLAQPTTLLKSPSALSNVDGAAQNSVVNSKSSHDARPANKPKGRLAKNRQRMITTALLIVSTFFFGWFPGSIFYLLTCSSCAFFYEGLSAQTLMITSIAVTIPMILKGIINPVIYAQRIPEFREAFDLLRRRTMSTHNHKLGTGTRPHGPKRSYFSLIHQFSRPSLSSLSRFTTIGDGGSLLLKRSRSLTRILETASAKSHTVPDIRVDKPDSPLIAPPNGDNKDDKLKLSDLFAWKTRKPPTAGVANPSSPFAAGEPGKLRSPPTPAGGRNPLMLNGQPPQGTMINANNQSINQYHVNHHNGAVTKNNNNYPNHDGEEDPANHNHFYHQVLDGAPILDKCITQPGDQML